MPAAFDDALDALKGQLRELSAQNFAAVMRDAQFYALASTLNDLAKGPGVPKACQAELSSLCQSWENGEIAGRLPRSRLVARVMRWAMSAEVARRPAKPARAPAKVDAPSSPIRAARRRDRRKGASASPPTSLPVQSKAQSKSQGQAPGSTCDAEPDPRALCASRLPGIGPKTAVKMQARQLGTLGDLAYFLPSAYLDQRVQKAPETWEEGEHVVLTARVQAFRQNWFRGKYVAKMDVLVLDPAGLLDGSAEPGKSDQSGGPGESDESDESDEAAAESFAPENTSADSENQAGEGLRLELRWFHRVASLGTRVSTGEMVHVVGQVRKYRGQWSMVHPEVSLGDKDPHAPIGVYYPSASGVGPKLLARSCRLALEHLAQLGYPDPLPPSLCEDLPGQFEALRYLHQPPESITEEEIAALNASRSPAHRRLAFDEFFYIQLGALMRRRDWQRDGCALEPLEVDEFNRERFLASIPFEPTSAQWRVIGELQEELRGIKPMMRLLQGDVGAGKTVVAFAAAMMCVAGGAQVAMMAPTEILAAQHYQSLAPWCEKAGIRVALLTGSTRRAERNSRLALLAAGEIDFMIGTHALLVEGVDFARLGLAVVDEQHRFGVQQRAELRKKGQAPHLLVMTATPIPRSLALTACGEMEVSLLDELPPGREPAVTRIYAGKGALEAARLRLGEAVQNKGVQAFVVCPLVEQSEVLEVTDVEATAEALRQQMPSIEVAMVHGRMSGEDKQAAVQRFASGEARVLVATTVIEVGIDVPSARIILIEHAERFGLAQLHQLRGRVGRGGGPSLCMLHTGAKKGSPTAERLEVLEQSSDGFEVAERDLELRGPGEVFGTRQSGVPRLRFSSFSREGLTMLNRARAAAQKLLAGDPDLEGHPEVQRELKRRQEHLAHLAPDAG